MGVILLVWLTRERSEVPLSESKTALPDDSTPCYNTDTGFRFSETGCFFFQVWASTTSEKNFFFSLMNFLYGIDRGSFPEYVYQISAQSVH